MFSPGEAADDGDLLSLPIPDPATGRVPAVAYARVSIARDLIRARRAAGLSQRRLAELAGVRPETLSRIESAKHTASAGTIDRITKAIDAARRKSAKARR